MVAWPGLVALHAAGDRLRHIDFPENAVFGGAGKK
jgi:hypothetical protein